jgi:hypothetical protein
VKAELREASVNMIAASRRVSPRPTLPVSSGMAVIILSWARASRRKVTLPLWPAKINSVRDSDTFRRLWPHLARPLVHQFG